MILLDVTNPDIAFDGWAIALIIFVLSCLGIGSYKVFTKSKIRQKQKAKNNAQQWGHLQTSVFDMI